MKRNSVIRFAAFAWAAAASFPAHTASLRLEDCQLEGASSKGAVAAKCGWYEVAENRDDPSGRKIRIHVAVVPALRKEALRDPVAILSGGPGQAGSDFYLSTSSVFEQLRRERDLLVIDQRGTGKSNRLDCKLPDELESARFDTGAVVQATRGCLQALKGDPRYYSTSVAVQDLDEIRAALGYPSLNLYGISYGTRVAQHYVGRYGSRVRSVVLDGVVPIDLPLGPEVGPAAQQALDAIFARCAANAECKKSFPELRAEFDRLRQELTRRPVSLTVPDPTTGTATRVEFGPLHLAIAVRLHSYSDDTASLLPFLIHEAAQGRAQALAAQAMLVSEDLTEQMANGMHNAVVCTEDVPFFSKALVEDPAIDRSYLGRMFVETLQAMCSVWPKGVLDADFHKPYSSATPALLLSGENDPVTPASYGDRAVKNFSHGKHFIVSGQGHGQLKSPCVSRMISRFIAAGTTNGLDATCIAKQAAAPFMLNATTAGP